MEDGRPNPVGSVHGKQGLSASLIIGAGNMYDVIMTFIFYVCCVVVFGGSTKGITVGGGGRSLRADCEGEVQNDEGQSYVEPHTHIPVKIP